VRENVGLGLELSGMGKRARREKIDMQLELVGLSQWADQPVSALSGGMQQRVGLARAFATEAPILLMDEPFSALDPLIRARLQDELLELQERLKRTIIFVSHDLDEAFKLGNRIAILEGGRMIQCGTPAQIFQTPANQYVADFVANMNPLGVLRARDALVAASVIGAPTRSVAADLPIRDVMDQFDGQHDTLAVLDEGKVLGRLTRASVMTALTATRGVVKNTGAS
jgi:glycine betaine/proline transport system ATP-binding protein